MRRRLSMILTRAAQGAIRYSKSFRVLMNSADAGSAK